MDRKQAAKGSLLLLLALVLIMMSISSVSAAAVPVEKPIKFYVQGKEIKPVNAPIIRGGRVYIEFRSAVKALGFTFNYDKSRKIITARSEDAFFKIDLNSGTTYVNGRMFRYDWETPAIIESGANTLVLGHLFHATDYLYADYYPDKNIAEVYESAWGKPKKADLRMIRAILDDYYLAVSPAAEITSFELASWGTYVTVSTDVVVPKGNSELLDRIEHATIEMSREEGQSWAIFNISSDIEYLDYESLSQKEVAVPDADKSAIYDTVSANMKALNDENSTDMVILLHPDFWLREDSPTKEEMEVYFDYSFKSDDFEYNLEQATIVSYEPNKAKVYYVYTIKNNEESTENYYRGYALRDLSKSTDGKWYYNLNGYILLHSALVE
ncbi:stalk domain-containing protein [Paenibacillus sp. FSL H8-0537]|uniref:stalk domain-containing protein n=1 Tax=Paenibacillus sp. FSL H8-0537 TaxID=2921399 RepID=UPI003101458F